MPKDYQLSHATPAQFRPQWSTYPIAQWILIIIPPKLVVLPTLYLTTEENKIFHLEETMTLVRRRHTILMVEKVNSFNITVPLIHHLMALQEYGLATQDLLHLHLNLTAWQVEHTLCLNGRQPGANIHMNIAMMIITRDKSTLVMLLCLLKIFTADELKTLQTMTPSFIVA
jgi:hypothetical protein